MAGKTILLFTFLLSALLLVHSAHSCNCSRELKPVCAQGRTFSNPCLLQCENEQRMSRGLAPYTVTCRDECEQCQ
ncbi:hypothetical protein JYU34_019396 [Plutella xylostella]|uniref:Kazal-like domain-containing protein n=1 Tax=Plutella xylostella TaxID=51655 RepID=A0ABQ7Q0H5_PLUXY|nr:hypothetical protein JYU34_019396 [Plutella xylostella]